MRARRSRSHARDASRRRILRVGERPRPLAPALAAGTGRRARSGIPNVVLTYPLNRRIGPSGEVLARKPWAFDTIRRHRYVDATEPQHPAHVGRQHGVRAVPRAAAGARRRVSPGARARSPADDRAGRLRPVQAGAGGPVVPALVRPHLQPGPAAQELLSRRAAALHVRAVVDQPRRQPVLDVRREAAGPARGHADFRRDARAEVSRLQRPVSSLAATAGTSHRPARACRGPQALRASPQADGPRDSAPGRRRLDGKPSEAVCRRQGAEARRCPASKKRAQAGRSRGGAASRACGGCDMLRAMPLVRSRVMPSLLRQELDQSAGGTDRRGA